MSIFTILTILSILLIAFVLMQHAKQDSLNTAFNGDEIHVTKVEKNLIKTTFTIFFAIILTLAYLKLSGR